MKKVWDFILGKKYLIYVVFGALLISMSFKSQIIILSYGDEYSLRMEYTVYGYCIRASAALKAAEPAVYNEMYLGGSIKSTVLKAVEQLEKLGGEGTTVKIMSYGFPRNNEKLELQLIEFLKENGKSAEVLSINDQ